LWRSRGVLLLFLLPLFLGVRSFVVLLLAVLV
jgi:hypothetical protein